MDPETATRLLALNRAFYASFARPFADSRPVRDPALLDILPYIPERARVLDVGCGNGRLAALLDEERPGVIYAGIDAVPELIELAGERADQLVHISAEFHVVDVTEAGWAEVLGAVIEEPLKFDCAVALAVLHHIPGFDLRAQVLGEVAGLLAPGGSLVLSTWQFLDSPRMRRKIVDWTEAGIPAKAVDLGDYLLDWKREGLGLRYCHLVDKTEVRHLALRAGFRLRDTFRAGGREGDLSLFAILERVE
jgi:SAM-dependent methyltransferase